EVVVGIARACSVPGSQRRGGTVGGIRELEEANEQRGICVIHYVAAVFGSIRKGAVGAHVGNRRGKVTYVDGLGVAQLEEVVSVVCSRGQLARRCAANENFAEVG